MIKLRADDINTISGGGCTCRGAEIDDWYIMFRNDFTLESCCKACCIDYGYEFWYFGKESGSCK